MARSAITSASLALAAIAVGLYLNTLPAQFTFDDNFAVVSQRVGSVAGGSAAARRR